MDTVKAKTRQAGEDAQMLLAWAGRQDLAVSEGPQMQ